LGARPTRATISSNGIFSSCRWVAFMRRKDRLQEAGQIRHPAGSLMPHKTSPISLCNPSSRAASYPRATHSTGNSSARLPIMERSASLVPSSGLKLFRYFREIRSDQWLKHSCGTRKPEIGILISTRALTRDARADNVVERRDAVRVGERQEPVFFGQTIESRTCRGRAASSLVSSVCRD